MIDTAHGLLDGTRVTVTNDVWDIQRRIVDGDPTLGWEGDPSMGLFVDNEPWRLDASGRPLEPRIANPQYGWFEVWGIDAAGEPYLAVCRPRCDASLIQALVDGHWRNNPALKIVAAATAREVARAKQEKDWREEIGDKLHLALRKDLGHLEGGLTRRLH